jgi:cytoskeletal protein CcmA (bactofilin family)
MERQPISLQDYGLRPGNQQSQQMQPGRAGPPAPAGRNMLLAIAGAGAKIEGTFHIADSIEIECEVSGEMIVGGRLVIGENAAVSADVQTLDAIIMGRYSGNMSASGSIEITSSGRVSGNLETNELIVAKGAIFTGNVTRPEDRPKVQAEPAVERQEPVVQSQAVSPTQAGEESEQADESRARPRPSKPRSWS